jgi:hypothetical protein
MNERKKATIKPKIKRTTITLINFYKRVKRELQDIIILYGSHRYEKSLKSEIELM